MKKEKLINLTTTFIIATIASSIVVYASNTLFASNIVSYDNTTSHIQSGNVQGAIDELYACASDYTAYNTRLTSVENVAQNYKSQIYPVGSIYISVSSTNPSSLFGGTWVQFAPGRMLMGVGLMNALENSYKGDGTVASPDDYEHHSSEITGGERVHTLKVDEMPTHTHSLANGDAIVVNGTATQASNGINGFQSAAAHSGWWHGGNIGNAKLSNSGGGKNHNNLPPYITVYMWKRTA